MIAAALGMPQASRAVGNALGKNRFPQDVPCHRVVRADGHLGGYAWGLPKKVDRLREEGVEVRNGYVNLREYGVGISGMILRIK